MANTNDTDELQELFDSIAASDPDVDLKVIAKDTKYASPEEVYQKLGKLTRHINSVMKDFGKAPLEEALSALPDARTRLTYVTTLTAGAAEKVLNAVDSLQSIEDKTSTKIKNLESKFDDLFEGKMDVSEFRDTFYDTYKFIQEYHNTNVSINNILTEVLLSQDFHDLAGQVISRIIGTTSELEQELLKLLLDVTPVEKKELIDTDWLSGPPITKEGRDDICHDQSQVDDLLTSLGF